MFLMHPFLKIKSFDFALSYVFEYNFLNVQCGTTYYWGFLYVITMCSRVDDISGSTVKF